MNWHQAMQAMSKGHKVRGTEWGLNSWMTSKVIHAEDYELQDFWNLTYEVLAEEPEKLTHEENEALFKQENEK